MYPPISSAAEEAFRRCIRCGMCLPSCPTYVDTQAEVHSPRGRIQLFGALERGELEVSPLIAESFAYCLGCYACQTACPAGVPYRHILEEARDRIEKRYPNRLKRLLLRGLFPYPGRLRALARLLYWIDRSGLRRWAVRTGLLRSLAPGLARLEPQMPSLSRRFSRRLIEIRETPSGPSRGRVGFLLGCVMDVAFAETNRASVDLLRRAGFSVWTPERQTCCGALHGHNGDRQTAQRLARRTIEAFSAEPIQAVITNAAGCGAFMKHYAELLSDDPRWAERAREFQSRVRDLSQWLLECDFSGPFRPLPVRATYHDACHHVHAQGIAHQPRALLGRIPDLQLLPLEEAIWCCGSAGIYSALRPEDAERFLERKLAHIRRSGAQWVITGNPGCILQLRYGIRRAGLAVEVYHYADVLRWALVP